MRASREARGSASARGKSRTDLAERLLASASGEPSETLSSSRERLSWESSEEEASRRGDVMGL
jgi:hypothetical protein